jgi:hypothetical protein
MPRLRLPGLNLPSFATPTLPPALQYNRLGAQGGGGLGCGEYRVAIYPRGAGRQLADVEWSTLGWGRKLDDTSTANVKVAGITGRTSECCGIIDSVEPEIHELGIIRSFADDTSARVWCGPVQQVSYDPDTDTATITASDLSWWLGKRQLRLDHIYTQVDLATIFADYVLDAMRLDDSSGLQVVTTLSGILGDRQVLADQHLLAGDQIGELARTGIDWTVVDRYMLAGGLVVPQTPSFTLVDEHFAKNPASVKDGSYAATSWGVIGGQDSLGNAVYGEAGGVDPAYGLIERVANEDTILDNSSATFAAAGRLQLTKGAPGIVTAGVLSPDAPINLLNLVAGTRCKVRLQRNCVAVDGDYRLAQIDVSANEAGAEEVKVSFQPVGVDTGA